MVPMHAIDIGNGRRAAGAVGPAPPGAYTPFGGGVCSRKGAAQALSAEIEIGDNPLKRLISRKEIDFDFVPKNLDFVPVCLGFVPASLEILQGGWEARPRPGLSAPAGG